MKRNAEEIILWNGANTDKLNNSWYNTTSTKKLKNWKTRSSRITGGNLSRVGFYNIPQYSLYHRLYDTIQTRCITLCYAKISPLACILHSSKMHTWRQELRCHDRLRYHSLSDSLEYRVNTDFLFTTFVLFLSQILYVSRSYS